MPIDLNTGTVFFSAIVSFILLLSLLAKDEDFIMKYLSPFYLDFAILLSAILIAGIIYITKPSIAKLQMDYLSASQIFVFVSFLIFFYFRITLKKRLKNEGYVITLMDGEEYEKLREHLDALKEIKI